jgi:hypothetical protein
LHKPLEHLAASVARELRFRERVYGERVKIGKMKVEQARHEVACMYSLQLLIEHLQTVCTPQPELFAPPPPTAPRLDVKPAHNPPT